MLRGDERPSVHLSASQQACLFARNLTRQAIPTTDLVKDVVDLLSNVGAKPEEFAVDSMQRGFKEVSLPRVFAVEELEQLKNELLVDKPFGDRRLEIGRLQKPQKEFVDQLQMRPRSLKQRVR